MGAPDEVAGFLIAAAGTTAEASDAAGAADCSAG